MAKTVTHACLVCAVMLPMEGGHDKCVGCVGFDHAQAGLWPCTGWALTMHRLVVWALTMHRLGFDHAQAAGDDPSSCMECFIVPLRTREAHFHSFAGKRPHSSSGSEQRAQGWITERAYQAQGPMSSGGP